MKKSMLFIVAIFLLSVSHSFANEEILIARVNDWPPFYYQQNGKWLGANVDFYKALSKESGVDIELRVLPWSRAMQYMKTKPIMIGQLTPTEKRKETMHFIGPHTKEKMILAIHIDYADEKIENLEQLVTLIKQTGKKVIYQKDVYYSKEFNYKIGTDKVFQKCFYQKTATSTVIKMISTGRVLGFFEQKANIVYGKKNIAKYDVVAVHPFTLSTTDVYFGISKTVSTTTIRKLEEANKRLLKNGTYDIISKKWSE
ncbi:MAG: amino acid ABC transporter substrate-binding protein [Desulfobacterales bacterium]|nr:amino acid ABC transporter substrate-binding protein [Desulfobacterales bacterium]